MIVIVMSQVTVILSDIRSTYNVGSILRSADCFGVREILISGITPYPEIKNDPRLSHLPKKMTSAIHKTALGAEKNLKIKVFVDTEDAIRVAKKAGYLVVAVEQAKNSQKLDRFKFPDKVAIILGNEIDGLSIQTLNQSDVILEIPMLGKKESLNVSVTAALALYEINRQC